MVPIDAKQGQTGPNRVKDFSRVITRIQDPESNRVQKVDADPDPVGYFGNILDFAVNPCHPQCKLMKIGNDPYQCLVKVKGIFWNINPP